jgi:hypothetical protein
MDAVFETPKNEDFRSRIEMDGSCDCPTATTTTATVMLMLRNHPPSRRIMPLSPPGSWCFLVGILLSSLYLFSVEGFTTQLHNHAAIGARSAAYRRTADGARRPIINVVGKKKNGVDDRVSLLLLQATTKKKGFGKEQSTTTKDVKGVKKEEENQSPPPDAVSEPAFPAAALQPNRATASSIKTTTSNDNNKNAAGRQALQELRRQAVEKRDAELRRVRDLVQQDAQIESGVPMSIPEPVANRMGQRMIPFVGLPILGGLATFITFWYLAVYQDQSFPPVLVATATLVWFAIGLAGITYSVLSASWDEEDDRAEDGENKKSGGDLLGFNEVKRNVDNIKTGLSRSRDNALVREQMARLGDDEIQAALRDLNERETKKSTAKPQTLQQKLDDSL